MLKEIKVFKREILGKKVKKLRKKGFIPGEVYGHNVENLHVSVPYKDFTKLYKEIGESTIINLVMEDNQKIPVIITEVQKNPLTNEILSVDFKQVKREEVIKVKVPLEFVGEAPATKKGYILVKNLKEIEVEALPYEIPSKIEVDLSKLENLKQSIHIKDLKIPKTIKILTDPETIVATVTESEIEEEITTTQIPQEISQS